MTKTNAELEPAEKGLYGRALEGLSVGLVTTNPQGRVTWLNREAQRILGIDVDASRGRILGSLFQDAKLADFWRDASLSRETFVGEVSLALPQAARLRLSAAPALDPQGEVIGRALLLSDVAHEHEGVREPSRKDAAARPPEAAPRAAETGVAEAGLTPQELRVLRLVGEGLSNRQIGERMDVAASTVRSHLKHLYAKLGLSSRSEAISYALRNP